MNKIVINCFTDPAGMVSEEIHIGNNRISLLRGEDVVKYTKAINDTVQQGDVTSPNSVMMFEHSSNLKSIVDREDWTAFQGMSTVTNFKSCLYVDYAKAEDGNISNFTMMIPLAVLELALDKYYPPKQEHHE